MKDITSHYEDLFRQLGVRLGRELAARILAERGEEAAAAAAPAVSPAPPKILPGLTGRRRRAGEAPPRCGRAGCSRPSRTRGYCQTHYVQWLKAGGHRHVG